MYFLTLEGLDGAGKSTQIKYLRQYYQSQNLLFETIHFPRLGKGYYGNLIAEYLRGDWGNIHSIPPKVLALLFAGDRREHIHLIKNWLTEGKVVLADRYVYSNVAYQSAKCTDLKTKTELKQWILDFEYGYYNLPQPQLTIYLNIPFKAVIKNLIQPRQGQERSYLEGKTDIHEADLELQARVHSEFLNLVKSEPNFYKVDCYDESGNFLDAESVHLKIRNLIQKYLSI